MEWIGPKGRNVARRSCSVIYFIEHMSGIKIRRLTCQDKFRTISRPAWLGDLARVSRRFFKTQERRESLYTCP